MSDTDSFISEVTEEVQRDRLFGLIRRYGWIAVVLVVLAVGGAGYLEWRRATAQAEAQALGDSLLDALEAEEGAARAAAIAALEPKAEAAPIVALLQAAERLSSEDPEAAAAALRVLADDATAPTLYRDLAGLKLVMIGPDSMTAQDRAALLDRLATPGQPFRHLAIEQQVYGALSAGETQAAKDLAQSLLEETGVAPGINDRLNGVITALGGQAGSE